MYLRLAMATLVLALPFITLENHDQTSEAQGPNQQERKLAVDLVRTVNTAEMAYRAQSAGSFAPWAALTASRGFAQAVNRFSQGDIKLKHVNFNDPSEIMTGWRLRLTVSSDNRFYSVLLADTSDKHCAYALVSDEEGIIREAMAMGCSMSK